MQKIAKLGWKVGWRIDPVVDCADFNPLCELFDQLLDDLPIKQLHSVSLGAFRMPTKFSENGQTVPERATFCRKARKKRRNDSL